MKRERVEANLERQFLIGLVTSKRFCADAARLLDSEAPFPERYMATVAGWALSHFRAHGEPVGRGVEACYHAWVADDNPDRDDVEAVEAFLEHMSAEYEAREPVNAPLLADQLARYQRIRKLNGLKDHIEAALSRGDDGAAVEAVSGFRTVSGAEATGYDPFDPAGAADMFARAFADGMEPLVRFPGVGGQFLNHAFTRDTLVGVMGPEKRGKTYWCFEMLYRAVVNRRRVAFFEVGDLSENQLNKRFGVRVAGIPLWRSQCAGVAVPVKIEVVDGKPLVTHTTLKFPEPLDGFRAHRELNRFRRRHKMGARPLAMFSVHSNRSINVAGIDGILERWRDELGFVPDVTVIDYADILAPERSLRDPRHQVDETWAALRRLSQKWHSCVVAPTQADAASYDAKVLSMKNFTEDKRKLSHMTACMGLNQTPKEKPLGVMRLNWLIMREHEYHPNQCLSVAQCLPLARAFVKAAR